MPDIYENMSGSEQIMDEAREYHVVDRIEYEGGIRLYLKGCDYPQKGMPTPESLFAVNQVKRIVVTAIKTFHIFLLFINKQKLIDGLLETAYRPICPFFLKLQYQNEFTKELRMLVSRFIASYGLKKGETANIISHVFEYDSAYRIRLQDLFTETTKQKLMERPFREVRRLIKLNQERDMYGVPERLASLVNMVSLVMLIPKVRRAFRVALEVIDFSRLQMDDADRYWGLQRKDYNILGQSYEDRKKMLEGFNVVEGTKVIR